MELLQVAEHVGVVTDVAKIVHPALPDYLYVLPVAEVYQLAEVVDVDAHHPLPG